MHARMRELLTGTPSGHAPGGRRLDGATLTEVDKDRDGSVVNDDARVL